MQRNAPPRLFSRSADLMNKIFFGLFACAITLWPEPVLAEASTFGELICNVGNDLDAYPFIVTVVCYIAGAFIGVRGILFLKKHGDNPNDSQIVRAAAHMLVAGLLMTLPAFTGALQRSIFGDDVASTGDFLGCTPGAVGTGAAGLDEMMQNFVQNLFDPITFITSVVAIVVGITMIARSLLKAAKIGTDPRASDPKSIAVNMIIGGILISTGTIFADVMQTIFGANDVTNMSEYNGIAWSNIAGAGADTTAIQRTTNSILAFVQMIGLMGFVRGWLLLKAALDGGQATVPQALTFIIGGSMAVNIDRMLSILDTTFGTGVIN